ncbi:MAG: Cystathionine gamma-synthase [Thermoanaerobaculia bacterium]|nr:Cystathionine gamma-synthase [Thermoanaerobaculia bacterium]
MRSRRVGGVKFETLAVHAALRPDAVTGAVAPPIHLSTTFARDEAGVPLGGHVYIRESNPTQDLLEEALRLLEGGETAFFFASGMAAGMAILASLPRGGKVLFPDDVYHGFRAAAAEVLPGWGLRAGFIPMDRLERLADALEGGASCVWLETPSNPLLKITDLRAAVELAHRAGALAVVDNTFATPVLQRPLDLGADAVLHAATKYFGGHSDLLGGAAIFARDGELSKKVLQMRTLGGGAGSPFNAWLVLRGLRTLPCRVERQTETAGRVAAFLASHPRVVEVLYPGLPGHPGHDIARKQMRGFGAMLSFRTAGGRDFALRTVGRARLFIRATSLGGVESLMEHRASSEGPDSTTPQDLIRLSIGLEHPEDLIEDLDQALA